MTTVSAWMLYGLLVSGLLTGAAVLAERSARAAGRPTRWIWAGAMLGSLFVPLVAWLWPAGAPSVVAEPGLVLRLPPITVTAADASTSLDRVLLIGWLASSLVMLGLLALSWVRLQRARRTWREGVVAGEQVLVSDDVGPAVVGVVRGRIVMPRWVDGLERDMQHLLMMHEREHLRAGDPRLLLAALVVAACAAWNPFLWMQLLRLRLAVEVDCDARVLRASGDVRSYGTLLLEVGRHRGTSGALAVAFGEPLRFLEERIRLIPRALGRRRLAQASALGVSAVGVLLLAVCARDPMSSVNPMDRARTADDDAQTVAPDARTAVVSDSIGDPRFTPFTEAPALVNRDVVAQTLESHYPPLLRDAGIGGQSLVWFDID
jgi:bla regulator protein blaR1